MFRRDIYSHSSQTIYSVLTWLIWFIHNYNHTTIIHRSLEHKIVNKLLLVYWFFLYPNICRVLYQLYWLILCVSCICILHQLYCTWLILCTSWCGTVPRIVPNNVPGSVPDNSWSLARTCRSCRYAIKFGDNVILNSKKCNRDLTVWRFIAENCALIVR